MRRNKCVPKLKLSIWISGPGQTVSCDPRDLRSAIAASSASDQLIRARMGYGHLSLEEALRGNSICLFTANFIEYGIRNKGKDEWDPIDGIHPDAKFYSTRSNCPP